MLLIVLTVFSSPALWQPTPICWLADDPLDMGRQETSRLEVEGVKSSTLGKTLPPSTSQAKDCAGATMTEKGKVQVSRAPPDHMWFVRDLVVFPFTHLRPGMKVSTSRKYQGKDAVS